MYLVPNIFSKKIIVSLLAGNPCLGRIRCFIDGAEIAGLLYTSYVASDLRLTRQD